MAGHSEFFTNCPDACDPSRLAIHPSGKETAGKLRDKEAGSSATNIPRDDGKANEGTSATSGMRVQWDIPKIPIQLNGKNWIQWSTFVRHHLQRKCQCNHLTEPPTTPITPDWQAIDSDILCTLWASMEPGLYATAITCPTARSLWDHLVATYSESTSMSRAYFVCQAYSRCSQGDRSLHDYYARFNQLVEEFEECFPLNCNLEILRQRQLKLHVLTFIGGLSCDYHSLRPTLLGHPRATTVESIYALVHELFTSSRPPTIVHESSVAVAYGGGAGISFDS